MPVLCFLLLFFFSEDKIVKIIEDLLAVEHKGR